MPSDDPTTTEGAFGRLLIGEVFWAAHQKWLEQCGYILRPRYQPGWVPSWKGTKKWFWDCEDGQFLWVYKAMDATRISDGALVALKKVKKSIHPHEIEIGKFLTSEPLASDPRNHCITPIDVLQVPDDDDLVLIVMPFMRKYNSPRFDTVGECVDYFGQVFEMIGIQFMHAHHVAHRDCTWQNIMMDPSKLYPESFHPAKPDKSRNYRGSAKHYTRTERPPRYYIIDFGLSLRYDPAQGPPLELPIHGGDKTVPEFEAYDDLYDPFPTDVYYLGNMIKEDFIDVHFDFEFIKPLVADMIQIEPSKRPTMDQVVDRFDVIRSALGVAKLRSRVVRRRELAIVGWWRSGSHLLRTLRYMLMRLPPVPTHQPHQVK